MNPIKIEAGAIDQLKNIVRLHPLLHSYISENDKEPSWDGFINVYNDETLNVEDIKFRIPIQVKGKNKEEFLRRNSISFSIEYKHLRNYYNDGGICYFVIILSNDGKRAEVFYNKLTPIKLKKLLNKTHDKKPDQTKNVTLQKLKAKNKSEELYKILCQFGYDSKREGASSSETIRKAIQVKDLTGLDSLRATGYVSSIDEMIKGITDGEICVFGHREDFDIWLPFEVDTQKQLQIKKVVEYSASITVDGIKFYDKYRIENGIIRIGSHLQINMNDKLFSFHPIGTLDEIAVDIDFLSAIQSGHKIMIGNEEGEIRHGDLFSDALCESIKMLKKVIRTFEKFEVICTKRLGNFSDLDWKAVNELINLDVGNIRPKEGLDNAWYMWKWNKQVYPIFLFRTENGSIESYNAVTMKRYRFCVMHEEKNYTVPNYIIFSKDIWEKLYNVPDDYLIEEIEKTDFNKQTEGNLSLLFANLLSAYDSVGRKIYYKLSTLINDKLLQVSPNNEFWIINKYQLIKRKRELLESELQEIENIASRTDSDLSKCGAAILLENKRQAGNLIDALPEEEKKDFIGFPIYNLLKLPT